MVTVTQEHVKRPDGELSRPSRRAFLSQSTPFRGRMGRIGHEVIHIVEAIQIDAKFAYVIHFNARMEGRCIVPHNVIDAIRLNGLECPRHEWINPFDHDNDFRNFIVKVFLQYVQIGARGGIVRTGTQIVGRDGSVRSVHRKFVLFFNELLVPYMSYPSIVSTITFSTHRTNHFFTESSNGIGLP